MDLGFILLRNKTRKRSTPLFQLLSHTDDFKQAEVEQKYACVDILKTDKNQ